MNPAFELDQVRRYISFLQENPARLEGTVESHFFPVLQRIFFREGLEVRCDQRVHGKEFPFLLVDLDLRRPNVAVDFKYPGSEESRLPLFAHEWASAVNAGEYRESLLVLRPLPLITAHREALTNYGRAVRFLDFDSLQEYATHAFESYQDRQQQRAAILVIDLLDKLIEAIASEQTRLQELHWYDIERLLFRVFQGLGFHAHQTPSSKDGGRDVLACEFLVDDVHWYNIEVKHWTDRKVGPAQAHRTLDTALREGRRGALLVSTTGATDSALKVRTEVHQEYLRFADGKKLVASCKHFTQTRSGLWNPHGSLRSFLFSDTL